MKEHKNLSPIVEKYREYKQIQANYAEAEELLKEPLDKDFKDMVQAEYFEAKDKLARLEDELKILLLPKDEDDDKSAIVEIRAGVGGEEATLFANSLYRMYTMYAETHGYKIDVLSLNQTELGGIKEITFLVEGDSVYSRLKFESGTHRVQRVPETESSGRIHTSAVTVAVLPEAEEVEIETTQMICRSRPTAQAAPAASTSIRRPPPFGLPICRRGLSWNARTNAVSSRTRTRR